MISSSTSSTAGSLFYSTVYFPLYLSMHFVFPPLYISILALYTSLLNYSSMYTSLLSYVCTALFIHFPSVNSALPYFPRYVLYSSLISQVCTVHFPHFPGMYYTLPSFPWYVLYNSLIYQVCTVHFPHSPGMHCTLSY